MKRKHERIFIIGPPVGMLEAFEEEVEDAASEGREPDLSEIDTIYIVAGTNSHRSLTWEVYQYDLYDEYKSFGGMEGRREAVEFAKKLGAKRPTII